MSFIGAQRYGLLTNDFELRPPTMEPEQILWIAVVEQAFIDAFWVDKNPSPITNRMRDINRRTAFTERARARIWFRGNRKDFHSTCAFAGLTPSYVKRLFDRRMRDVQERQAFQA